jgi:5-methylthioadenosine/S-adenosylhomocysteine deaminase
MHHPASAVVYAAKGSDVHTVMVAGRWLLKNRQLQTLDVEEIMFQVNRMVAAGRLA